MVKTFASFLQLEHSAFFSVSLVTAIWLPSIVLKATKTLPCASQVFTGPDGQWTTLSAGYFTFISFFILFLILDACVIIVELLGRLVKVFVLPFNTRRVFHNPFSVNLLLLSSSSFFCSSVPFQRSSNSVSLR